jgi:hypothetical protein
VTEQTPTPDLMLRVQTREAEPVRRYNPRVPADLEAVVRKCLEKERERRYTTAAELAADLGRWQRGEPVQAQAPSLGYLLGKLVRRHWKSLSLAASLLLAVVLGVAAAFWEITTALSNEKEAVADKDLALGRERDARTTAQENLTRANQALREAARGFCEVGERDVWHDNPADGLNWLLRAYELAADGLNWLLRAYELATEDDPRRASYGHLISALGHSLGKALVHNDLVHAVAFSPDGRTVLTGSADKTARLWEVAGPAPEDLQRVRAWVHVRTGKKLDERGGLRTLTHEEWRQDWEALQERGGDWDVPMDSRRWHLLQATEAERDRAWFAARFHLDRLLADDPANADLLRRRKEAEARLKEESRPAGEQPKSP